MTITVKEIIALLKKETKNAEKTLARAAKTEKDWDYSDTTFTIERAYAEGYAEALHFILNRIEEKKTKKKGKK